ncbi:hypothetical protein, partial [Acinetobacter stercoris]
LNVDTQNQPKVKIQLNFQDVNIYFYEHCVGAFSYFSKKVIQHVGLYDESYFNALEHLDHTYMICQEQFHPSFWYFADIENSSAYIGDDGWSKDQSVITAQDKYKSNLKNAEQYFFLKYQKNIYKIEKDSILIFVEKLELINESYGEKKDLFQLNRMEIFDFIKHDIIKQLKYLNLSRLFYSIFDLFSFYTKSIFLRLK